MEDKKSVYGELVRATDEVTRDLEQVLVKMRGAHRDLQELLSSAVEDHKNGKETPMLDERLSQLNGLLQDLREDWNALRQEEKSLFQRLLALKRRHAQSTPSSAFTERRKRTRTVSQVRSISVCSALSRHSQTPDEAPRVSPHALPVPTCSASPCKELPTPSQIESVCRALNIRLLQGRQWTVRHFLGAGRSARVVAGQMRGSDCSASLVALKCYDMGHGRYSALMCKWEFFLTELQAYCKLQHLQGSVLPRLHFVARDGPLLYLGLDVCDEVMPDDISCWTDADQSAMHANLRTMRENGVVQNDVRGANFGRRAGRLLCFDLEDCQTTCAPHFFSTMQGFLNNEADANKENHLENVY